MKRLKPLELETVQENELSVIKGLDNLINLSNYQIYIFRFQVYIYINVKLKHLFIHMLHLFNIS